FRVVGINAKTANGSDLTLTTAACPPPVVLSISPAFGLDVGGTAVTIVGTGFRAGAGAALGGVTANNVIVVDATTITATTPPHTAGLVSVAVTNSDTQVGTLTNAYSYSTGFSPTVSGVEPPTGSVDGGI